MEHVLQRMGDMSYQFADSALRSHNAERDTTAPRDNDGRSKTHTGFNPSDAPLKDRNKWRRLNKLNDGMRAPDRAVQNRAADTRRTAATYASQLELPKSAQDRVLKLVKNVDINSFGPYSRERVIIGVCTYVAHENGWHDIETRAPFRNLLEGMDLTQEEVRRTRELIRDRL